MASMRAFIATSLSIGKGSFDRLVHVDFADTQARAVEVELHVGVAGQEAHRHGGIGDFLRDHERRQPHSERVVVLPGVPDGDFSAFQVSAGPTVAA